MFNKFNKRKVGKMSESDEVKDVKPDVSSFWESEKIASIEAESSGGNGWIAHTKIAFGYKVFVSGATNEESFFEFDIANQGSKDAARKDAGAFAKSHMAKAPSAAIAVVLKKEETYLYDTSKWKTDRWWVIPTYTRAYEEVLKPSLKATGATLGWQWLRVGLKPDPYKPTRKSINQLTGEETEAANLVPFIMEVFANKESAVLAASKEDSNVAASAPVSEPVKMMTQGKLVTDTLADSGEYPEGWTKDNWSFVVPDIKKMSASGTSPASIAKEFDIPIRFVIKAIQE